MGILELAKDGQHTANEVIKKATQTVYESSFKKFSDFCIANGYPDPRHERHHELPVILVAYLQSISASSSISLQTAEKARSAVASYYSSHQNTDGTDVNTWRVQEDESGKKRGYGNPARDPFVRQFMRGLKKKKASEYVPAKAVPISLDMITVLHAFLESPMGVKGFSEESRVWFKAVSSFAFYGMCRINEVLTLQWKDITLRQTRCSVVSPDEIIEYGTYALFNRKTAVAEGRMYNLHHMPKDELAINAYRHLCNWVDYASERKGHHWRDDDYVFPALSNISKKVLKTNDAATGCEKVGVGWGKKMSEQVFINLLNCIVRGLNRDGKEIPGYVSKHWTNSWFTSHTFRRAGAQYRFMYAQPARRWSLRMIKWWAGWNVSESTETLVRYLLDVTIQSEDNELADCLAPDKTYLHGCPSAPYEAAKNTEEGPVLKRLRRLENLMLEMKAQITTLAAPSTPSPSASAQDDAEDHTEEELEPAKSSVIPAVQDWAHLCLMWWIPDKSLHLFKPLSKWTLAERTNAGLTRSWYSVAKLLGEDIGLFASILGETDHLLWKKNVIPVYRNYYTKHYVVVEDTETPTTITIAMLASFVRKDRKNRIVLFG
ncbi:hypothetical protein PPTG_00543 [Phytophthora nicotianae INRA-310]|uniref:Tyr recombinase domain-containing protein n=1 Tax=Phytophthora nicotianae (strain INRA-310) TaxID=761204 RepID=W2RF68_PHYN3|nr:hypothetical protein PPTG_00543 [Phytophthora nicotianae INRA-310]ETN24093.1 hypothetical protein PPTG_00543 [Phytophthora nicotianae INRA-310]